MQSRFKKISCEMESKKERIHIKTLILANEVKTLGYWKEKEKRKKKKEKRKKKEKKKKETRINITASRVLTNHNTNVTRARFASPIGREGALS